MISSYPVPGAEPRGGVERSAMLLVGALARRGVEVTVIAPGTPGTQRSRSATVLHVPGSERLSLARAFRPWRRSVLRVLEELKPDLVHGQGLIPGGIAAIESALPTVVTAHGNLRQDTKFAYSRPSALVRGALRELLGARVARRADAVIGVHPDWSVNLSTPPRRFAYIPNGVDDEFFRVVSRPEAGLVLYCGGPAAIKGWPLLARAWPMVLGRRPDARLELAGWSPAPLDGHAPLPSSRMLGRLSARELSATMERASVLVLPSRFEVAPLLVGEAWAAGVPVVATAVGGLPRFAAGAANLVPPDDCRALAEAIVEALSGGPLIESLVAAGRRRADEFRAENVARKHLDLYEELLSA